MRTRMMPLFAKESALTNWHSLLWYI